MQVIGGRVREQTKALGLLPYQNLHQNLHQNLYTSP